MAEYIAAILLVIGAVFLLLAAVGLVRMPDLFARMHATTKAATLGSSLMLVALVVYFRDLSIGTRAVAVILFLYLTAPVTAHMIGRAAHMIGIPLWKGTVIDELKEGQRESGDEPSSVVQEGDARNQ